MNEEISIQPAPKSALATMGERLEVDSRKLLETLKATAFKGASDQELLALVVVANQYGLNPLTKEIYAFQQRGGIVPIVSVDGWLRIANQHPQFDGVTFEFSEDGDECTCTIHRKDRANPTVVREFLAECYRPTEQWKTMPKRMLRHKAFIQAARVAFGFAGIYDPDEAEKIRDNRETEAASKRAQSLPYDPFEKSPDDDFEVEIVRDEEGAE